MWRSGGWKGGRLEAAAALYGVGLVVAYQVLILLHRSPPSLTDYANWTYQGILLKQHVLGLPDPAHALKPYPVPNSAATLGIGLFSLMVPWQLAAKCWLGVELLAGLLVLRHFAHTVRASWAMWVIAPAAILLNMNLWYGFVNFQLGLCCVLLLSSQLARAARAGRGVGWGAALVLVACFACHMIPLVFCWLLVGFWSLQTRRWRTLWHALPTAVLTTWYLAGRYLLAGNADGQAGMLASVRDYSAAFWAFKVNSYLKSFGFVNPLGLDLWFLGEGAYVLLFACNLLLAGLIATLMRRAAYRAFQEDGEWRFLWAAVLLMMPVFLFAPGTALGISDPGARVLQVALSPALLLGLTQGRRVRALAAVCSLSLGLTGVLLFAREGFGDTAVARGATSLPERAVDFAHIPNTDQDYFYSALEAGRMDLKVFPTGLFLNR